MRLGETEDWRFHSVSLQLMFITLDYLIFVHKKNSNRNE